MITHIEILDSLLTQLRSTVRGTLLREVARDADGLVLQVGSNGDVVVGIRIVDATRPLFQVSYPRLVIKRDGTRKTQETVSDRVAPKGVEWICVQLAENGVVKPEFSN